MNYLLDKRTKKKKFFIVAIVAVFFCFLFYFRVGVFQGLSYASHTVFRPVLVLGNKIGGKVSSFRSYFISKNSLLTNNKNLKLDLDKDKATMANYNSILAENQSLKEILGRKDEKMNMVLSAILSKPNQSPYDTLIIDAGTKQGIKTGNIVFAFGNVPIGRVDFVYENSAKVVLFSNTGEETQAIISIGSSSVGKIGKNIFIQLIGRGGGNFETILSRDLTLTKGDQAVLPGIVPRVIAIVETVISDPRDSFSKALLVSPVNIQELKFVEVELQK